MALHCSLINVSGLKNSQAILSFKNDGIGAFLHVIMIVIYYNVLAHFVVRNFFTPFLSSASQTVRFWYGLLTYKGFYSVHELSR